MELYVIAAVLMVRIDPTADASLADMRARSRFGIAMAARVRMIATTISNSMREKPLLAVLLLLRKAFKPENLLVNYSRIGIVSKLYMNSLSSDVRPSWSESRLCSNEQGFPAPAGPYSLKIAVKLSPR